jgi:hypothetical protein
MVEFDHLALLGPMTPPRDHAVMRRALGACAVLGAALTALAGCGDGARDDAGNASGGPYIVAVERATFAARQHVGQRSTLTLAVRNAGTDKIPDLVVTLRGLRDRAAGRGVWLVDEPPVGATAADDTWDAGVLAPGATATLRWAVTPIVAGARELRYEITPALGARAAATLASGRPASGVLTVGVADRPAQARVDPRTGEVRREE